MRNHPQVTLLLHNSSSCNTFAVFILSSNVMKRHFLNSKGGKRVVDQHWYESTMCAWTTAINVFLRRKKEMRRRTSMNHDVHHMQTLHHPFLFATQNLDLAWKVPRFSSIKCKKNLCTQEWRRQSVVYNPGCSFWFCCSGRRSVRCNRWSEQIFGKRGIKNDERLIECPRLLTLHQYMPSRHQTREPPCFLLRDIIIVVIEASNSSRFW